MAKTGPGGAPPVKKKKPPPKKGSGGGKGGPPPVPVGKLPIGELAPVQIPKQYVSLIQKAAAQTGMPVAVVAVQIDYESSFNSNAVSPTGAQGIAQFEPGTWRGEHCSGSPFIPSDAITCYIKLMRQLLGQFHGNLRNALAAYNAGAGDLAAGYGYADHILSEAGGGSAVSAGGESIGTVTLPPLPSVSADSWSDFINEARGHLNSASSAISKHAGSINVAARSRQEYTSGR
jgi:hypothetical protein